MNVLITAGADGALTVHKDTCKKIEGRETQGVDEVLDTDPKALTLVKKASCCKPSDSLVEEVEQAGWDALEQQAAADAGEEDLIGEPTLSDEAEAEAQVGAGDDDEDLIGTTEQVKTEPVKAKGRTAAKVAAAKSEGRTAAKVAAAKSEGRTAAKVAAAKSETKELNGLEALKTVAAYLDIDLGESPKFPGFGRAFKTAEKQSVYINSKGNADARAKDAGEADTWAKKAHVERRAGNYVRVNLSAI